MCINDSRCKDVIILGDFNFPSVEWLRAECGFTEFLQEARFFQVINAPWPTRGHNLIGLLLTTNEYLISKITVTDDDSVCLKSDHKAITVDINVNMKVKKQAKRTVYNYAKGDFNSLRATLRCLPLLEIIDSEHDVDTAWEKWKGVSLTAVDSHITKSTVKSSYRPPYATQNIIHELNKKETLKKIA